MGSLPYPLRGSRSGGSPFDIETSCRLRVEVRVGAKATGMNAVDGAEVIDLVDVTGDAERTHDFARRVADELAAAFEEQRPIRKLGKRVHEGRLLF